MSYAPYQRNTSGIVFFGEQGNQPTFYSDTNFLIQDGAAGHIQTPNLIIGDGGDIGSVSDPDAISIASNGNVTMSQSLSVVGDLTVNGTTTTVDSTIVTIEDPVVIIGAQAGDNPYGSTADDNKDRGIAFYWNDGGSAPKIGFFGHDDSIRGFTYIPSGDFDAASGVITGPVGWAVFHAVSGDLVGDVTGNASTATALETARDIALGDQMTGSASFDGTANITINVQATPDLIQDQVAETSPSNDDLILILDSGTSLLRKQTRGQFVSGLGAGSMDSFNVTADAGTNQTINDANTLDIAGGSGIQTVVGATDTVTVNVKVDESTISIQGDILEVADNGITATQLNTSVAGNGLSGGGGTALAVDLSEFSVVTLASGDSFATLDVDGVTEQRTTTMDLGTFLAGDPNSNITVNGSGQLIAAGSFTSFTITDGSTPQTIEDGDTITFSDSTRINFTTSATDTVSADLIANTVSETYLTTSVAGAGLAGGNGTALAIDISEYGTAAVGAGDSFLMLDNDGTTEQRSTVDQLGTYLAGTNITNTAGVLSVPDSTIDGVVFEAANFVDSATIDFTVTAGTSVTAIVIDGSITEAKRSRSVVTDSTTSTLAATDDVSLVNAAGGAVTITLTGVATSGKRVTIKKTDSSANAVTIQRDGSSTIDGATTKILYSQYESITLISDGTNWHII